MSRATARSAAADRLMPRVEDEPTDDDIAGVDDALAAFTLAAAGHGAPRPLAVFARRGRSIVAGIDGWTWGGCCELVSLWVSEPLRGRGLGRALLTPAEARARARRCHQVVLFTHAFRTPDLYIRAGYDLVGEIEDYPAGSAAYWFRKQLDGQPGARIKRIAEVALWVAVAVVLAAEVSDGTRLLHRRAGHAVAERWAAIERRDRRDARRSEITALGGLIMRRMGDRAATGE